jgi:hypothetical protein
VADPLGHAIPARKGPRRAARDVAGDFEAHSVLREEAEAVAAAGAVQRPGFEGDLTAGGLDLLTQRLDVGARLGGEADDVDAVFRSLAQTNDIGFVMASACLSPQTS